MERRSVTCTKRLEWDAAHRVTQHGGKCANLHGHRWAAEITVVGETGPEGMVLDFGVIKATIGRWIDEKWDHAMLASDRDQNIIQLCKDFDWKVYVFPFEPTAENLAECLREVAARQIGEASGLKVDSVRICETPTSWATAT